MPEIDWHGRSVYVGVDLAMTNDNCSVVMVASEGDKILALPMAFIPAGRIDEKSRIEKLDYREMVKKGIVTFELVGMQLVMTQEQL